MLSNLAAYVAWTRKALINTIGLLTSLLALGLLPSNYAAYVATAIAVGTAILHFMTGNAPQPGTAPAEETVPADQEEEIPDEWKPAELVTAGHVAAKQKQLAPPSPPSTNSTT